MHTNRLDGEFSSLYQYMNIWLNISIYKGNLPNSELTAMLVFCLEMPNMYLQNFLFSFSYSQSLNISNKDWFFLFWVKLIMLQFSQSYDTIGLIVWSNICSQLCIDGEADFKSLYNLKLAFSPFSYSIFLASPKFSVLVNTMPRYLQWWPLDSPKVHYSEGSLVRRSVSPKVPLFEGPLVRTL